MTWSFPPPGDMIYTGGEDMSEVDWRDAAWEKRDIVLAPLDPVILGKAYITNGWLRSFREATGVSRAHLAKMINVMPDSVRRWEAGHVTTIANMSARKVHDLAAQYNTAQAWMDEQHLTWDMLTPMHLAAMTLGGTVGDLDKCLVARDIVPIDFGIMGRWLTLQEVNECRRR